MLLVGVGVVLVWRFLGWHETVAYEVMPGMLSGLAIFALGRWLGRSAPAREVLGGGRVGSTGSG